MKAIMVMYDSLSKRMLPQYGNTEIIADNFKRLEDTCTVFDNFYAGSLPCMPARRELHTGRYNFLHNTWGPVEPFDDSMPEILKKNGIYSHIVSDHLHYWGDGGATYHTRYSSWECVRGQVADSWVPKVADADVPPHLPTMREFTHPQWWKDYWKNREKVFEENLFPQNLTFGAGLKFLEDNVDQDNWFLQIETFDPHEPFDVPDEFVQMYGDDYDGDFFNSPPYGTVTEDQDVVDHAQALYKALITMCDKSLGRVLDFMDAHDMWKDTMLIVNTDHGLLVGEKDWWAKSVMPCYNELSNTPFAIWDPRTGATGHRKALAQAIDIAPTLLDFFGLKVPEDMQGRVMMPAIKDDTKIRDYAMFGYMGSFINITDGETTYMRAAKNLGNTPCYNYTLMPTDRPGFMNMDSIRQAEMVEPFTFTKDCPTMKLPFASKVGAPIFCNSFQFRNLLWDVKNDYEQTKNLDNDALEAEMINCLVQGMKDSDAPLEQYERVGLDSKHTYVADDVTRMKVEDDDIRNQVIKGLEFEVDAETLFVSLAGLLNDQQLKEAQEDLKVRHKCKISFEDVSGLIKDKYAKNPIAADYFIRKLARIR